MVSSVVSKPCNKLPASRLESLYDLCGQMFFHFTLSLVAALIARYPFASAARSPL